MSPLTDERRRTTRAWWDSEKGAYSFHAQSPTLEPSPTDVARQFGAVLLHFIAVPMGDETTWWGFETAADRDAFLERFPQATELAAEAVFGNPV